MYQIEEIESRGCEYIRITIRAGEFYLSGQTISRVNPSDQQKRWDMWLLIQHLQRQIDSHFVNPS